MRGDCMGYLASPHIIERCTSTCLRTWHNTSRREARGGPARTPPRGLSQMLLPRKSTCATKKAPHLASRAKAATTRYLVPVRSLSGMRTTFASQSIPLETSTSPCTESTKPPLEC